MWVCVLMITQGHPGLILLFRIVTSDQHNKAFSFKLRIIETKLSCLYTAQSGPSSTTPIYTTSKLCLRSYNLINEREIRELSKNGAQCKMSSSQHPVRPISA